MAIEVIQGESTQITFTLTNQADLPDTSPIKVDGLETAGYTVSFLAKYKIDDLDGVAAIAKDNGDTGGLVVDSATVATITLTAADTNAVTVKKNQASTTLYYTVRITHSSGEPQWIPIAADTLKVRNAV